MLKWLNLSALVIVFDQLSKWWANSILELYQSIAVLPFF
jgi:signal peptidase II